jgi:hypothetical protein
MLRGERPGTRHTGIGYVLWLPIREETGSHYCQLPIMAAAMR